MGGWSVLTGPSSISGAQVTSSTVVTGTPASASSAAVFPDDTSSKPSSTSPRASSTRPVLSYTESRARFTSLLPFLEQGAQHLRVEASLDFLDALVERLGSVVGQDRHGLLGEDRAVVEVERRNVDGAAGHLDAGRERVLDRVRALERPELGRMRVRDHSAVRVVDRMLEDGHEPGHGDEVDLVALERVDDPLGVRPPVEVGPEALALDELDGHGGPPCAFDRPPRAAPPDHAPRAPS